MIGFAAVGFACAIAGFCFGFIIGAVMGRAKREE